MQTPEALNAAFVSGNSHTVVVESLRMAGARSVLDIGCGGGALVARLSAEGFVAAGVDPHAPAVEAARNKTPAAQFAVSGAQSLPFEAESFEAAVFLNSLHHVPVDEMGKALDETRRVTREDGAILIVEPLAEGSYFETMRLIEDETAIRHAAGVAIADAVREGRFRLRGNVVFRETVRFKNVDEFLSRLVSVDASRAAAAERLHDEIETHFRLQSQQDGDHFKLVQPLRIYWLEGGN